MSASPETAGALLALSNDLAGAVERAGRAVVAIHARQRIPSSGVHWRPGVIATADHTIKRDEEISVTLADGRSVPATLAGRDATTDLAVLKLDAGGAPVAELGDASSLKVGHMVLALGRAGAGVSASLGVVSAVDGEWRTWRGGRIDRFLRLDLAIYDGFSGGPLVDASGAVVGINTSALARGLAVSIPASTVNRVVDQLLATGRIARGYIGVGLQPVRLPEGLRKKLKLAGDGGVIVVGVEPGGPAEQAGMMIGDVVVAVDGAPLGDTADLMALLGPERVGKPVVASVVRGGALSEVTITVGERSRRSA